MTWGSTFGIIYRGYYFCGGENWGHSVIQASLNKVEYAQFCAKKLFEKYSVDEIKCKLDEILGNSNFGRYNGGSWGHYTGLRVHHYGDQRTCVGSGDAKHHEWNSEYGQKMQEIFKDVSYLPKVIEQQPNWASLMHYEDVFDGGFIFQFSMDKKSQPFIAANDTGTARMLTNEYPVLDNMGNRRIPRGEWERWDYEVYHFASFVNLDKRTLEVTYAKRCAEIDSPEYGIHFGSQFADHIQPLDELLLPPTTSSSSA